MSSDPSRAEIMARLATLGFRANPRRGQNFLFDRQLLDALIDLLNRGIHPVVPQIGSLGASGDLAPLAHVGAVLTGERNAEAYYRGRRYRIGDLPSEAGLEPIELAPKEAMALTNGTSFMLAELVLLSEDAKRLCQLADVAAALSLEAMLGEPWAFDARVQTIRGHRGQEIVARNIRSLLHGGEPAGEELRAEYLRKKVQSELERDRVPIVDAHAQRADRLLPGSHESFGGALRRERHECIEGVPFAGLGKALVQRDQILFVPDVDALGKAQFVEREPGDRLVLRQCQRNDLGDEALLPERADEPSIRFRDIGDSRCAAECDGAADRTHA